MSTEEKKEISVDAETKEQEKKIEMAVSVLYEKLSRSLGLSLDNLRNRSVVIKDFKVTVK